MSDFNANEFLSHTPNQPGIYQMLDENGTIIYVGKAKNLKARVSSYFRDNNASGKTRLLVSKIHDIKIIVTHTETEALLLEQTLIKTHHPRYNILLRDDKSYPYIYLTDHPSFPTFRFYRGPKRKGGRYFGPYPNSVAVRETLELIQKFFKLRSCQDQFFANRSRPCLQYQINRCKAPCVNLVSQAEYQRDIEDAILFLQGKDQLILDRLRFYMEQAAEKLEFEKAIQYRQTIADLQSLQQKQFVISNTHNQRIDLIFAVIEYGVACIQKMMVREGKLLASKSFFPSLPPETEIADLLNAFLAQHYLNNDDLPQLIYVNADNEDYAVLEQVLSEKAQHKMTIDVPKRGEKFAWLELAKANALQALQQHRSHNASHTKRLEALQALLNLSEPIQQIECFDISHTQGESTVASCVVFDELGPKKSAYRYFNISDITPGDDYAAMEQALRRRYQRVTTEKGTLPTILIVDGGKGQMTQAENVLQDLGITSIILLGIAKGTTRKAGLETIFLSGKAQGIDANNQPLALHLLQEIRDEAHRFAITGHRARRGKTRNTSLLEYIEGIGPMRRRELLRHFGGLQALQQADIKQIAAVPGINLNLAEKIYQALH